VQVNITKLIDDVQCYQTVRELRWPNGVACPSCESKEVAQFLALCSKSKWSKYFTNSPFLALLAMDGSQAAYKIISACSHAVS
jgi:Transposase zinc-ribbon domain